MNNPPPNKISFDSFSEMMLGNPGKEGIEILFHIDGYEDYQDSWMGKLLDKITKKEVYWYGLVGDGSQAYEFESFGEFINASVFHGKSLKEVWDCVFLDLWDG